MYISMTVYIPHGPYLIVRCPKATANVLVVEYLHLKGEVLL